ncbi:MAG TPA: sulfur oxidation c-type cytochrome SoxA [Usitatibacter sp.]|nr:sulfur oxidation c-type cytochrome SoxA [Usitatibacter sp.]
MSARLAAALALGALGAAAQGPQPPQGGSHFQSADLRALQADDFANPGMLWAARGEALWSQKRGEGPACSSCHGEASKSMRGVAASYPKHSPALGKVLNLEQRINACVTANQKGPALAWESDELLGLTTYVARQSNGMPVEVSIDGPAAGAYERGRTLYFERQGQLNLACNQCHDANWGKTLLAEKISQGHPVDWPAYRMEWQKLGSLQRRLRACYFGVRAALPDFGSPELVALELYLAARARGLSASVPGVRR